LLKNRIKEAAENKIKEAITKHLPPVLKQVSKRDINTPDGLYEVAFVASPTFISEGIVLHLGVQKDASSVGEVNNTLPVEGFNRTLPSSSTDLQPLLKYTLLSDIKPIILESSQIKSGIAGGLEIESDEPIDVEMPLPDAIPFTDGIKVNFTKFEVDENDISWNPKTDISFIEGAIHTDIIVSFKFYCEYETNSTFLKTGAFYGTVQNFRIISDLALNFNDDTLQPVVQSISVSMDTIDVLFII